MNRKFLVACMLVILTMPIRPLLSQDTDEQTAAPTDLNYIVVCLVEPNDPYEAAAKRLVDVRNAKLIHAKLDDFDSLLGQLKNAKPDNVAFVARPEQIDMSLANRILDLSTKMDDDPFVDFAYGFITGRTPETAMKLASAGFEAEKKRSPPSIAIAGVAGSATPKSTSYPQKVTVLGQSLSVRFDNIAVPKSGESERDEPFIESTLKNLEDDNVIVFAGHGYPDGVVDGPKWKDLIDRDYTGAVAFNVACYTGVTSKWYENDWSTGKLAGKTCDADESFCLRMLDTGVAAYIGYACPRPAGPEMLYDAIDISAHPISIGEQRRRHANSIVLTHLGQGFDRVVAKPVEAGQKFEKGNVDVIVRPLSTGSLLFGDPAFIPFPDAKGKSSPTVTYASMTDQRVEQRFDGMQWFWKCSDQLEQPKMRFETQIPLADKGIKSIKVSKSPLGKNVDPLRVNAAIEEHNSERVLHIKALYDKMQPKDFQKFARGVSIKFEVVSDPEGNKQTFNSND